MAAQLMTPEHKEKLMRNWNVVVENISVQDIYIYLLQENIFTEFEFENIIAQKTRVTEVEKLLETLLRKPEEAYKKFIKVLRRTQQEHVANLLDPEAKHSRNMATQLMTPEHKEKLIINWLVLVENISIQDIYTYLLQENIFTTRELDDITAQITRQERVEELLDILARKSDEAYLKFIDVLRESGQEHVANLLEPDNFINSQTKFVQFSQSVDGPVPRIQIKDAKARIHAEYSNRTCSDKDSDHFVKIKRVHMILCEFIRPTKGILPKLLQENAVSLEEYESISSERTMHGMANHLLLVLSKKPLSSYQCFLRALDATNQQYLHNLLEQNGEAMVDALLKHKAAVRLTLECQYGLIGELDSRLILSEEELIDLNTIGKNHGLHKENDELLRIMIQQTDVSKQEEFLLALRETNQRHLANYLVNDGCMTLCDDERPLTEKERNCLRSKHTFLVDQLLLEYGLLTELHAVDCLNDRHVEGIETHVKRSD